MQTPRPLGRIAPETGEQLGNVTKKSPVPGGKISLFSGGFGKILFPSY